ncbi:MAG: isochorismatase family protein [Opitutaceae bacterium]|nr:isochorismatase family protein [Opitutaceae bacterium]
MSAPNSPDSADTLLLCVDLQPKFIAAMENGPRLQRRCAFAIAAATGLGLPVAFTEQVPEKLGATAPELRALAPQAPAWAKTAFSALGDERIRAELLDERALGHLLLCGLETPVCIYQTALAAKAAGLHVTVLSDAVGARRTDDAQACLAALARAGVHFLPAETVFYALLGDVRHPFFKTYTALVKSHA